MLQLLAFDPTCRISAEAALKILSRSAQPQPQQHAASPPPAASVAACSPNRLRRGYDGGGDGDFWKLERILGVSRMQSASIDARGLFCSFCMCRMRALLFEQLMRCIQSFNLSSTEFVANMKTFLRHTSSHISQGGAAPLHFLED
jgi:hypothetical protein